MRIILLAITAFLFIGCSPRYENDYEEPSKIYKPSKKYNSSSSVNVSIETNSRIQEMRKNEISTFEEYLKTSILGNKDIRFRTNKRRNNSTTRFNKLISFFNKDK